MIVSMFLAALLIPSQAQDKTVAAPTRLDADFAAQGFGLGAGKIPADYDSKKQKYQLFVPKSANAKKPAGILVFISPGDGPSGLGNFQKVCEKEGLLFCSPYGAGNNTPALLRARIVLDAFDDVRRNFTIDPNQAYIGGFSGGGRMACAIAFGLPEHFAGVLPVCGTNPISGPTYLRHRLQDRVSVAFITGEKDFNRKENEEYMYPQFQDMSIRSKLWVVEKLAHAVPGPDVMAEVVTWLNEDLKRRQEDVRLRPNLAVDPKTGIPAIEQARRHLLAAQSELKTAERIWRGVTLLQGITQRWPKTDSAPKARAMLQEITKDDKILEAVEKQGSADEIQSISAQAKSLERFGDLKKAIEAWEILVRGYQGTTIGQQAEGQVRRLRALGKP